MNKTCIVCKKQPSETDRRYCHRCYLDRRKIFYLNCDKSKKIRCGIGECLSCKKPIILCTKNQKYCKKCFLIICRIGCDATNNYENAKGDSYCWMHRRVAEQVLKRKLSSNEVVHHLDENYKNNHLENLIVISRSNHGKLHWFLKETRATFEKSKDENLENCWNNLRASMTTTWLETANVKVIKLWEIGQSAAEPLNKEEGSETMHKTPINKGDDIVQTTT